MIKNGAEIPNQEKSRIAAFISRLSKEPNASLLEREPEEILKIINSGITLVDITGSSKALFIVAFNIVNLDYVEVNMVCNLDPNELTKGKEIFPHIINAYREISGSFGKYDRTLFLSTTNSRMTMVAPAAGFRLVKNIYETFPPDVCRFCCSPCPPKKTGAVLEQQLKKCPRFTGEFIPTSGKVIMHRACEIFVRSF